ncbi:hypothetical protein FOCC_FOCC016266 [Frankliniella occidentalis]|nr:hypothetical protein FOCC_FOCC016266 [Frankliniella occidentalis]
MHTFLPALMRAVTMCLALGALAVALAAPQQQDQPAKTYTEEDAKQYLNKLNAELLQHSNMAAIAEWAYASNITDETLQNKLKVAADTARFQKEAWKETVKYPWTTYKDPNVRRQFKKLSVLGAAALPEDKYEKPLFAAGQDRKRHAERIQHSQDLRLQEPGEMRPEPGAR